ncbi:MAG: hypothetical protein WBI04_05195 [Trichlorobacter sp.]
MLALPFEVRDIKRNKIYYNEWHKTWQGDIVPVIVFDNGKQVVDGFDIRAIKRALREVNNLPAAQ